MPRYGPKLRYPLDSIPYSLPRIYGVQLSSGWPFALHDGSMIDAVRDGVRLQPKTLHSMEDLDGHVRLSILSTQLDKGSIAHLVVERDPRVFHPVENLKNEIIEDEMT